VLLFFAGVNKIIYILVTTSLSQVRCRGVVGLPVLLEVGRRKHDENPGVLW